MLAGSSSVGCELKLSGDKWQLTGDPYILYRAEKAIPFCAVAKEGARVWPATEEIAVELLWLMNRFRSIHSKYELVLRSAAAKYNLGRIAADKVMRGEYDPGAIQFREGEAPRDYQAQNAMLWRSVGGLLCADGLGTGKCQPLDCKVLTPSGWAEIGSLEVGDSVVDPDGGVAEVKGVYDRGIRKVYRVTTKDGRSTRCCDEHLWTVLVPHSGEMIERTVELRSFQYPWSEFWHGDGTLLPMYDTSDASVDWLEVKSIEFEACVPTVCIAVTSKRNLYVTDDYLVTHNTISGLAGIAAQDMLPALIVAPSALCLQWKQQIEWFLPGLSSHIIKQQRNYDLQVVATCESCGEAATAQSVATRRCKYCKGTRFKRSHADIYLLSYNLAQFWNIEISRVIKSVIYEEAHELRLSSSNKYTACKYIANAANFRLGLTGSPVMNWGGEMYNIINVLCPGKLGTKAQFQETWCSASEGAGKEPPLKEPEAFAQYLKNQHMMTRRTREDVGRYIPEEQQIIHNIDFDETVFSRMTKDAKELARAIVRMSEGELAKPDNLSASRFNQMVYQATGEAKAPFAANFAEMILESGEPIMLFAHHRNVFEIYCRMLGRYSPLLFTGSENRNQKEHNKQQFMAGKSNLIICSLMSGVGIDGLQNRCNIGVFGELAWSPGVLRQCVGRYHRDGQKKSCLTYILTSEVGIDPYMMTTLGVKRLQVDGVVQAKQASNVMDSIDTMVHLRDLAKKFLAA